MERSVEVIAHLKNLSSRLPFRVMAFFVRLKRTGPIKTMKWIVKRMIGRTNETNECYNVFLVAANEMQLNIRSCEQPVLIESGMRENSSGMTGVYPLISVLLPVYNHSAYIGQAVESVQNQTYRNWELVILDDGSTDDLFAAISPYLSDVRIKLYRQENQKLPRALTHLHALAQGEYITWTSADNIMAPQMLETLVGVLLDNPSKCFAYADVALIDSAGDLIKTPGYRDWNRDPNRPEMLRLCKNPEAIGAELDNFMNACFLYRAAESDALMGHYASDLKGLEDYDFWLRLTKGGGAIHAQNDDPLYFYRDHSDTMSFELLNKDLNAHINRAEKMMNLERERQAFFDEKFTVCGNLNTELERLFDELPVYLRDGNEKKLQFIPDGETANLKSGEINVQYNTYEYTICKKSEEENKPLVSIAAGTAISKLALKTDSHKDSMFFISNFDSPDTRQTWLIHIDPSVVVIDELRRFISANTGIAFALVSATEESESQNIFKNLAEEFHGRCKYFGYAAFGEPYKTYACCNAFYLPLTTGNYDYYYHQAVSLAMTCDRWLVYCDKIVPKRTLPYALPCGDHYPAMSMPVFPKPITWKTKESFLQMHSPKGQLEWALRLANLAAQEECIPRPDFGIEVPPVSKPAPFVNSDTAKLSEPFQNMWIGMWVDTFDRGGLEQVIAMLCKRMYSSGIDVRVLCNTSGGLVAGQLEETGIPVIIFDDNEDKLREYLKTEKPLLLTSHYTRGHLGVPAELGIPVIEVVHNTYIHDAAQWKKEDARAQHFNEFIAVSELVGNFYQKNAPYSAGKTTVVPNASDYERISAPLTRTVARQNLGIGKDDVVFLNVGSFHPFKNQLGLLYAFEQLCENTGTDAVLVLIGNYNHDEYKVSVQNYMLSMKHKERVRILEYSNDIASMLNMADIFVMPSFVEGWSIAATEALYYGLYCVLSDCGSGRELTQIGGKLIGLPYKDMFSEIDQSALWQSFFNTVKDNTDDLISAVSEAYKNIDDIKNSRPSISSAALTQISLDRMMRGYLEVYKKYLCKK